VLTSISTSGKLAMVPEAVRTGRGKGARTGVVRMAVIFMA
jgi:hypothetical protein